MIPPLIHQIWIDTHIPDRFVGFRDGWIRQHPDWAYRLWTDADILAFVAAAEPEMLPVFNGHTRAICRADIGRYLILKHHGGLYVDLDFECLRPIDPLLDGAGLVIGIEPESHVGTDGARSRGMGRILCPSLIASEPGHALWNIVCERLRTSRHAPDVLDATGPFLLTRSYDLLEADGKVEDARLLPANTVYPVDKFDCWRGKLFDIATWEEATRDAYALHHWDGGWFRGPDQRRVAHELRATITGPAASNTAKPHWDGAPLVSCLMATRDRPAQARLAIAAFRAQTYPNRELVIVDDSAADDLSPEVVDLSPEVVGDQRIRVVRPDGPAPNLGRARNRAVAEARGDYVCQWDDDDLYDPLRLEMQMAAMRHAGARACLLSRWLMWWPNEGRLAVSRARSWEGSLICERRVLPTYLEVARGEDTPVVEALLRSIRVVHLDAPRLYVYVVHGRNTFSVGHFDAHWKAAAPRFTGERYRAVLRELGKRLPIDEGVPRPSLDRLNETPRDDTTSTLAGTAGKLLIAGRHAEAALAFERLRRTRPSSPLGLDGLARIKGRDRDWIGAADLWRELATLFPTYLPGLLGLGQTLMELGRFAEAEAEFERARRLRPELHEPAIGLAETAARARDWRLAHRRWAALRERLPRFGRAIIGSINADIEMGRLEHAATDLDQASGDLDEQEKVLGRAMLLQRSHRDAELSDLLGAHQEIVSSNAGLRALQFQLLQGRIGGRGAVRALAGELGERPESHSFVEALGNVYAADGTTDPRPMLEDLHVQWQRHGVALATPDLLTPLIRAAKHVEGPSGAEAVLRAVEAMAPTEPRAVKLNMLAVFERLRLDGGEVSHALRGLACRCDPRAPLGHWREALYRIANAQERIENFFPDAAIGTGWDGAAARRVVDRIIDAVAKRRPFSLVRLGDGEGNFLDYPSDQAEYARPDRDATQRVWWGAPRLARDEIQALRGELLTAIRHADVVGVPDPCRLCAGIPLPCPDDLYASWHDLRGLLTIQHHLAEATKPDADAPLFHRGQLLTSCHIHADLAAYDLYEELFAHIGSVAVVTCHQTLADRLQERFGLAVTRSVMIPHERKYGGVFGYPDGEAHYPDAFVRLRNSLAPAFAGEVVIVAAGFLGKLYCEWIRQRGGIALDLGSIVDHWCGFNTRAMQFRQRYAPSATRAVQAAGDAVHGDVGAFPVRRRSGLEPFSTRLATTPPEVLVLTPVRDAARTLPLYAEALGRLDYPVDRMRLAFLEGDGCDGTASCLKAQASRLTDRGWRVRTLRHDFGFGFTGPRWEPSIQRTRRSTIARARNRLMQAALRDESWVLWIDADVIDFPSDVLRHLLAAGRDVVVPHCVLVRGGPSFDLNTFVEAGRDSDADGTGVVDGLRQPARGDGRLYLDAFRGEDGVAVHSVGGTMLLVRADLHRDGLIFPTVPVDGYIETEGFAAMARAAGHQCWGLPDIEILHARR